MQLSSTHLGQLVFWQQYTEDMHGWPVRRSSDGSVKAPGGAYHEGLELRKPNNSPSHSDLTCRLANIILDMATNQAEGRREDALVKQRTQMREEFERQKQSLINETEKARPSAHRFVGQHDSMEDTLKKSTVGLVKLEEFQQRRKELEEAKAREAARTSELKYVMSPLGVACSRVLAYTVAYRMWRICLGMSRRR